MYFFVLVFGKASAGPIHHLVGHFTGTGANFFFFIHSQSVLIILESLASLGAFTVEHDGTSDFFTVNLGRNREANWDLNPWMID